MQLRAIFITHIHGDHTFDLPGLLTGASMLGRTEPLDIIAPVQGQLFLARDFDTYRLAKDLSLSCLTTETTTA